MKFALSDVDRLLDPSFSDALPGMEMAVLREKRAECEYVEVAISYLRRTAHARLDIVHFDQARRRDGREADLGELVERLPGILSGRTKAPGTGRLSTLMAPDLANVALDELDEIVLPESMAGIGEMSDAEVETIADRLESLEADLSDRRRALHELLDRFHQEIVRRYQSGEASIDQIFA